MFAVLFPLLEQGADLRLGLALSGEWPGAAGELALTVNRRLSQVLFPRLGETALLYRRVPFVSLSYLGCGQVSALEAGDGANARLCRLTALEVFSAGVDGAAELGLPGGRTSLLLEDSRFDGVLAAGRTGAGSVVAAEATAPFEDVGSASLDLYLRLHDQVLADWNFSCAVTGQHFGPAPQRPHPQLDLVAIKPREAGGPLHAANYLPMIAEAAAAWRSGDLSADADFGFLVRLSRLDPELQDRLRPQYRLLLPSRRGAWPDPSLLAFHRQRIFGR